MAGQENDPKTSLAVKFPPRCHLSASEDNAVSLYRCSESIGLTQGSESSSTSTSPTLVRSSSFTSVTDQSPVIRSMFPIYDTALSISEQQRSSDVKTPFRREKAIGARAAQLNYSPSLYSRRNSVLGQPSGSSTLSAAALGRCINNVSTAEDLIDLWSLANGQDGQCASTFFRLSLLWFVT